MWVSYAEPTSSTAPRVSDDVVVRKHQHGETIDLLCQAQAYPPPLFRFVPPQ